MEELLLSTLFERGHSPIHFKGAVFEYKTTVYSRDPPNTLNEILYRGR
jgi:hypothetical protein